MYTWCSGTFELKGKTMILHKIPFLASWMGWILVGLYILLCISWLLARIAKKKKVPRKSLIWKTAIFLKKIHGPLAWTTVLLTLLHALGSGTGQFAAHASGLLALIMMILVCLSCVFKKQLPKKWLKMHRWLSAAGLALIVVHIILSV